LIGTDYIPEVKQRILFLEDVNEKPHRIDRMFWQLFETGIFSKIKGLVLGEFPFCFRSPEEKTQFFDQIGNNIKKFDLPIIYDLPFGHAESMFTLPLGVEVELDLSSFEGLVILEDGVR
jgi:muramoyltetrapeptide carboxypeptidase